MILCQFWGEVNFLKGLSAKGGPTLFIEVQIFINEVLLEPQHTKEIATINLDPMLFELEANLQEGGILWQHHWRGKHRRAGDFSRRIHKPV